MAAISFIILVFSFGLALVALHELHLHQQAARMLAIEECELTSQLESERDTLTDGEAALFHPWDDVERSGVLPVVFDDDEEPTIPNAQSPAWDMHEASR